MVDRAADQGGAGGIADGEVEVPAVVVQVDVAGLLLGQAEEFAPENAVVESLDVGSDGVGSLGIAVSAAEVYSGLHVGGPGLDGAVAGGEGSADEFGDPDQHLGRGGRAQWPRQDHGGDVLGGRVGDGQPADGDRFRSG